MKTVELQAREHGIKIGHECQDREPNVTEDTIFTLGGKAIAYYRKQVPKHMAGPLDYANTEFRSKRVPKSEMRRSSGLKGGADVRQYSTILGYVPPKPNMGRNYSTISSVHSKTSAWNFIMTMQILAELAAKDVERLLPEVYEEQKKQMSQVNKKHKLHDLWTSAICNYNIAASYHRDTANIPGTVNVIWTMKRRASGGHLHVPDYDLVLEGGHQSMIVYPAWFSIHGVTPIHEKTTDGYRNSLVLYPLRAAQNRT